jgi:WD40-like Beta Propeller Repeat
MLFAQVCLALAVGPVPAAADIRVERVSTAMVSQEAQGVSGAARSRSPRIVFVGYPRGTDHFWLYAIRINGKGLRRITRDGHDPSVSPGRKRIAFSSNDGVSVVDVDGGHRRHLVGGLGDLAEGPAWSPGGKKIGFMRAGGAVANGVWTMNPDGSGKRFLPNAPLGSYVPIRVAWFAPDHMIIHTLGRFAIISAQDGFLERWITPPTVAAAVPPAVSPDRRELAYDSCNNSGCSSESVVIMTLNGRLIRKIPGASSAAWTPRGELLYTLGDRIMIQPGVRGHARAITPRALPADEGVWLG